jgi:AbrB family looped-hinge helix DNA binding protein
MFGNASQGGITMQEFETSVTEKGQVTIPQEIRRIMGLQPRDKVRFLTRDDEQKAQQALDLLLRIERGEEKVITSPLVIFETIFTLQKLYKVPRDIIKEQVLSIISLRSLHLQDKSLYPRAFDLYISKNISFADAYNAVYMHSEEIAQIYTWDKDFVKIEGITQIEPQLEPEG